MTFISVPLYFPISKSKRVGLDLLQPSQEEEEESLNTILQFCDKLGKKHNCNVSASREIPGTSSMPTPLSTRSESNNSGSINFLSDEEAFLLNKRALEKAVISIHIYGPMENAMKIRNIVVRLNHRKFRALLRAFSKILFTNANLLRSFIRGKLEEIELSTHTNITILGEIHSDAPSLGDFLSDNTGIEIIGFGGDVVESRIQLLSLLTSMEGYTTFQTVEIPLHLIPIVAGRKNAEINKIMLHTKTIIYMPPPFILKNSLPLYALEDYENTISPLNMSALIFGDDENATKTAAKKILNQLKLISTTLLSQAINLGSANKRDWILKTQLDFLYEVMQKTATYFSIPPLGSDSTIVTVYGSNQEFLLKATRILARLLCEFFLARIKFSPIKESLTNEVNLLEQNQTFLQELGKIASENGSELVFNCDTISVYGTYNSLLLTCNAISELPHLSSFNFELQIESELEAEHKEFFVGKKSGKVKNITWNTSTDITLAPGISSNILVSLYANNLKDGLHAFELIRDEYPAEISFYVPEESHKRVIGIKGANIQRLTSIHKAFVRFSNAEEHKRTGGYFENEDNVIARTPVKLSHFLLSLKKEIFHPLTYAVDPSIPQELPPPEYLWHRICVSRRYHSYLLPLITPTKQLFKAQLEIPCREFGCDEVLVFCEGIYLNEIKELLLQNTPLVTQIDIPVSEAALSLISHPLFTQFLVPEIKSKFNVDLSIISSPDIENLYFLLKCDANTTADFYSAEVFFFDFLFKNNIPFQSHQSNSQMSSSIPQRYLPYFNSRVMTPWSSNRKNQNPN